MERWIVVGLGNPGPEYTGTRHNAGADFLRRLAATQGLSWKDRSSHSAREVEGVWKGVPALFVCPTTYMNESGKAVRALLPQGFPLDHLVVVHDELDLPIGQWREEFGRGHAGHNGIRSIIEMLGSKEFGRIRIGIAPQGDEGGTPSRPRGEDAVSHYVLGKFRPEEREVILQVEEEIVRHN